MERYFKRMKCNPTSTKTNTTTEEKSGTTEIRRDDSMDAVPSCSKSWLEPLSGDNCHRDNEQTAVENTMDAVPSCSKSGQQPPSGDNCHTDDEQTAVENTMDAVPSCSKSGQQPPSGDNCHTDDEQTAVENTMDAVPSCSKSGQEPPSEDNCHTDDEQIITFDSAEDEDEDTTCKSTKKVKDSKIKSKGIKKTFKKKFVPAWVNLPVFKGWLAKGNSPDESICKVCNVVMKAGKSELKKHSVGKTHMKNIEAQEMETKIQPKIESFVTENSKIKNAEAAICAYIVKNNLPMSSVEGLMEMIKALPEKSTIDKISLGKQKATNIIRNGLRPFFNENLINTLKDKFFSVYIDETTDVSTKKQLAVMISYSDKFETKVDLVDIVDCPDGTAHSLYTQLINTLKENNVPLENWIGFCADTTATMMGQHHSVSTLIQKNHPHVLITKCACHMIHLVSNYACMKLSTSLEDLCRNIFNHFNRSPKNSAALKEFQIFFDLKPHKMLRPSQTRWLSLHDCVKRILEQWQALEQYWSLLSFEDKTHGNQFTYQTLRNPFMKCLMYFVEYSLGLFNDFNTFFQTDGPQFVQLKSKTEELIKNISLNFMKPSYVKITPASQINPLLEHHHVEHEKIYLGVQATQLLSEISDKEESEVKKLYESVKQFYIESILQIKKRFVFENIHIDASFLDPQNASNLNPTSLAPMARKYLPRHVSVDLTELDKEWRTQSILPDEGLDLSDLVKYWTKVFDFKTVGGSPKFKHLPVLINYFLSLPFSNATVERLFSDLKNIKTDKRNRLENETIGALLCVKYGLRRTQTSVVDIMRNAVKIPHLKQVKASATTTEAKKMRLSADD